MRLTGVILGDPSDLENTDRKTLPVVIVPSIDNVHNSYEDFRIVEMVIRKTLGSAKNRRYPPIKRGQMISWESELDVHQIHYRDCQDIGCLVNVAPDVYRLCGIIDPDRNTLHILEYMLPPINIRRSLSMKAMPNVVLECGIILRYDTYSNTFTYGIDGFEKVSPERQFDAYSMPWNADKKNPSVMRENPRPKGRFEEEGHKILDNRIGYIVSNQTILCPEYSDYFIVYAIHQENMPTIGSKVIFGARWIPQANFFAITNLKLDPTADQPTSNVTQSIKRAVHRMPEFPNWYECKQLGLCVDDPLGLLKFLPFQPFADSSLFVTFKEGKPNCFARPRYYINEVIGQKRAKLEKYEEEQETVIDDDALVLTKNYIFYPKHPSLPLYLDEIPDNYYPGDFVKAIAEFDKKSGKMQCVKLSPSKRDPINTQIIQGKSTFAIVATGHKEFPRYFHHEVFGLIEPPPNFITPNQPHLQRYKIWIELTETVDMVPPPTLFKWRADQ